MSMNRDIFVSLLPHRGEMCLLDQILDWSPQSIRCATSTHRLAGHPLRGPLGLSSAIGIEYGAQAMALHAMLAFGDGGPRRVAGESAAPDHGVVASVRGTVLHVPYLDWYREDLTVNATMVSGDGAGALYTFEIDAGLKCLVSGRATVMFALAPRMAIAPVVSAASTASTA